MPSLKSFLSDQETSVDLINSESIAKTIVALVRERPDQPVTIGVHGDWGVGKSSILEMIEADLSQDKQVLCIKFNGWRFQGFEDAKIALLEGIVAGLVEERSLLTNAAEHVKGIFKRIDWLKVAKKTGGLALTALTGLPSPDLIQSAVSTAIKVIQNPSGAVDATEAAINDLQGLLKPDTESKNVPEEVREFQKAFDELLEKAGIEQLIVLVDDLDRCLPDTAIETLEAIRLFVLTARTAFIVAADEAMIEYAVRRHFPELPDSSGPQMYARNYLEKLIQIPFRIPPLGGNETCIYVALAMAQVNLGEDSQQFRALLEHARDVLKRPWLEGKLSDEKVKTALGEKLGEASELLALSDQIGVVLAQGTSGNPRQIKRFLNAMFLRERIAQARGFGEDVKFPILAKLLLAERFKPKFFDDIVLESASDPKGISKTLTSLDAKKQEEPKEKTKDMAGKDPIATVESRWLQDEWVEAWCKILPPLDGVDLRPYAFVANQQARMALGSSLGPLLPLLDSLMGPKITVAALWQQLEALTQQEASALFQELTRRIRQSDLKTSPEGVDGLRALVSKQPILKSALLSFLQVLPTNDLGIWVTVGWSDLLDTSDEKFLEILGEWYKHPSNKQLSSAAFQVLKQKGLMS